MPRNRGFTLIELMVVLALVALATASVAMAMRSSDRDQLEREAERLGTLLDAARAEARTQSVPARWRVLTDATGTARFAFDAAGFPAAVALAERVANLPTHVGIDANDRERLVGLIGRFAAMRSRPSVEGAGDARQARDV